MTAPYALPESRSNDARRAVTGGRRFVEQAGFPLGVAMIDHAWSSGSPEVVIEHLAAFQNDDGGFGRGLEVDIGSPASNPFAARLAMSILLGLGVLPGNASDMTMALQQWLIANQADDGDWHFSRETRSGDLAPWFAGWTFPALNPACCLAGLANRLGIATPEMLERVARLFSDMASLDAARTGDFYNLLPYVEYTGGVEWEEREAYLDAIASNIAGSVSGGRYEDAGHFWEHVLGGGSDLVARLAVEMLSQQADRLLGEQGPDGGWPTPYNDAWRPLLTAQACCTLARLRDGI